MQNLMSKKLKIYNTAIYCRLSRDDGIDDLSSSIQSQRDILTDYVKEKGWNLYDIYIDDGYSGTTFERPAFKKLLKDIENNLIDCIVTKDLSRLGRNYLQTGYYTEEYFPLHNVRFIAINDNYDSSNDDNDFTPFKNIINEWYAKDISKKIKTSFRHRQKEGTLVINSPYGYRNNATEGRVIDPAVAYIVKFIFEEFTLNSKSVTEICKELTDRKILIPKVYKYYLKSKDKGIPFNYSIEETYKWTRNMLYRILREYQYTGALTCNKYHNLSFKNKKIIPNAQEEWLIHEDKYEPIISKKLFQMTQERIAKSSKNKFSLELNKYNGILYCGMCQKKLKFLSYNDDRVGYYRCRTTGCGIKPVDMQVIDGILKEELLKFQQKIIEKEDDILNFINFKPSKYTLQNTDKHTTMQELESKKDELEKQVALAFEAMCDKTIPRAVYDRIIADYNAEMADIAAKMEMLNTKTLNSDYDYEGAKTFIKNIKLFNKHMRMTRGIISSFVSKIELLRSMDKNTVGVKIHYRDIDWIVRDFNEKLN